MELQWAWWRFGWGALGAAAPEIIRLYRIVTDPGATPGAPHRFTFWYFSISLVFLILGGAVAVAWGENNALKCIWVGASVPLIISSFASQIPSGR